MRYHLLFILFCSSLVANAQSFIDSTEFHFGGYMKADFLNTWYNNGEVGSTSPLREFHLPSQIPIGPKDINRTLDFHVRESRFSFDIASRVMGEKVRAYIELDFLLSGTNGNERVTNSFNPRMRHFFIEWKKLLVGQTWSTFMTVIIPDDLDFTGAMDGIVIIRQPMIRFKAYNWWFAIENPETTLYRLGEDEITTTEKDLIPDLVVRRNFYGQWGQFSISGIYRILSEKDSIDVTHYEPGYGLSSGGKFHVGSKGDDFRFMVTAGKGLGRYQNANFIAGGVLNEGNNIATIASLNGYLAWNHFWIKNRLSSSFNSAYFISENDQSILGSKANISSYSFSGNLKYTPVEELLVGIEYMYGHREVSDATSGSFHRIQLSAKYWFGYKDVSVYEK